MAVTAAALAWAAAYLVFDVKPEQVSKYFPQLAKEEQGHQSDGKNSEGPPTEAKFEVPERKPEALEGSSSVLEVSSYLPFISSVVHFYAFFGHFFWDFNAKISYISRKGGVSSVLTTMCASGRQGDTSDAKGNRGF